ncbi:hypothetical protein PENTCL1PPCAC_23181 [Pristionchus entomophagus]|uniref:INTS8 TPR repeats domain-containing protein n=1 Tax=Pristionchus entomophagus TaxID=358040 RepID=A0AAV5U3C0_9BILA|nr:hypothetical protein PENTCL1PPCAC_23181 [Pristionchus entomophagus]
MDIDISCVHELWAAPKENWLDHFVNTARFKKLLNEEKKSDEQKDELRILVIQFAEQAVQVEAETDTLVKKQFGQEDITFHQRKASCLWLCCLASLSAIDWHFESLMEKPVDIIIINSIFERIELWNEYLSSPSSLSFSTYLLSRWILFVHAYFRIPPPEAKQTVSNPCNQLDMALQKFDHARSLVMKLREHIEGSLHQLDLMTSEKKPLLVPRPDAFIDPFIQNGGLSLSIGIVGNDVLTSDESLRPRVPSGDPKDTVVLSIDTVLQKIYLELASSFFCTGQMTKAVSSLKQLLRCLPPSSSSPSHPLIRIDERKVNGFAAAFRIPPPYESVAPSTSRAEVIGEITSTETCPRRVSQRRYGTRRDRRAEEEARTLNVPLSSTRLDPLSMCDDAWTGGNTVGWRWKMEKANEQKRKETVEYLRTLYTPPVSTSLSPSNRSIIRGTARFINAIEMESPCLVECLSLPSPSISLAAVIRMTPPTAPPPPASIRAMAASDKPFWTLLTSFDASELQTAFQLEGNQYTRPAMLSRYPEVLANLLLRRPVDELHALLLGKLQQLTEMGDPGRWRCALDSFMAVLGLGTTQTLIEMSIYEAARVQMLCLNRQLFSPHSNLIQAQVDLAHSLAKKLVRISQVPPLIAPMTAFLLNKGEFEFICERLDPEAGSSNVLINAGRLLAAYGIHSSTKVDLKSIAKTWHGIISPYFEAVASKRRHDGFTTMHLRETSRMRIELIKLFQAIKLSNIQEFLISYFASIYTQALAARGRAHLRIYSPRAELFSGMSVTLAHMESLEEVLSLLLDGTLSIQPHKTSLLRTKADFAYVRNQLNEASIIYCELLVAMKPSLSLPLPANNDVIDDSVWNHLRICLRKNNQQTLAACVCQLFKTGRAKEFRKAAEAIQDRSCLDSSDDCFSLIYDVQLSEALTDAYRKRGQQQKLEALLENISSPTMNLNNGPEVVEKEMRRKQKRMLNTLASLHFGIHSCF